jgi:flagellar basal-body rod protein FlgB
MNGTIDPLVGRLRTVLDLRQLQHSVTASNLANANTPGFRAKVVEFDRLLESVVYGPAAAGTGLRTTDPRHVSAAGADPTHPVFTELDPPPWSVDGNSVLAERESARLNANALQYEAVSRGLDHHLRLLKFAVSDGRS